MATELEGKRVSITVEGWIQIALGFAALFLGPAAGTYYGGTRRTQLDDRRRLLKGWGIWIVRMGAVRHFDQPPVDEDSADPKDEAEQLVHQIQQVDALARLLPRMDRALWQRASRSMFRLNPELAALVLMVAGAWDVDGGDVGLTEPAPEEMFGELFPVMREKRREQVKSPTCLVQEHADAFRNHLIRKANPTPWSRVQDLGARLSLVSSAHERWPPGRLRPARIDCVEHVKLEYGDHLVVPRPGDTPDHRFEWPAGD